MDAEGHGQRPSGRRSAAGPYRREGNGRTVSARQGRPPKATRKVNQTIRLDPDVLAAYRQEGRGWQTLINTVLREHMPGHRK